jgi:hypothetical protein
MLIAEINIDKFPVKSKTVPNPSANILFHTMGAKDSHGFTDILPTKVSYSGVSMYSAKDSKIFELERITKVKFVLFPDLE